MPDPVVVVCRTGGLINVCAFSACASVGGITASVTMTHPERCVHNALYLPCSCGFPIL